MTEDTQDLEPIDLSAPPTWPEGWYADPWTAGQYRYWNGRTWTGETNRWGPTNAGFGGGAVTTPWPAAPTAPASGYGAPVPPTGDVASPYAASPYVASPYVASRRPRGPVVAGVIGLVLLLIVSAVVGYAINSRSQPEESALNVPGTTTPPSGGTAPTTPGGIVSQDPDREALVGLVVRQADVGSGRTVLLIPGGNLTTQPTLDLCNGTFPSEKLRTARLQVAAVNDTGDTQLSTEAVLYRDPAAADQGLSELRGVRAACPDTPVKSPVSESTATTKFNAVPDSEWPRTATVDRQAYSFVTTAAGESNASVAVYLRRGRVFVGVYFLNPKAAQAPVAGQTSIAGIVGVLERRIAGLPDAVVNAP